MSNRYETIKIKMEKYINQLGYKLSEVDSAYLINQSPKLFNLRNIDNENLIHSFFEIMTEYYKNSISKMFKTIENKTTSNKRNKKESAIKSANIILDYLGGSFSNNENAKELKLMLKDFIRNPEKYKNKDIAHTITKDDLRSKLRIIIPKKSRKIEDFVKGLENFKI